MKLNNINQVRICYSCMGCTNSCQHGAIRICYDRHGYSYPRALEEMCINCGKCVRVCRMHNGFNISNVSYVFESKDQNVIMTSSSGGAFYHIAKIFLQDYPKSKVYGAKYDANFKVIHDGTSKINEVTSFQKSKYVISDINDCFKDIQEELKNGIYVLFSGTPCQVHGLKKYLGEDFVNLYTIDLICTGVMYPNVFDRLIEQYSSTKIDNFDWRYKHQMQDGKWNIMDSRIVSEGKTFQDINIINIKRLYGKHYCYKESCYQCEYASLTRCSDITLGDYWDKESCFSSLPNKGSSAVIVNTSKGEGIIQYLLNDKSVNIINVDIESLKMQNPALTKPVCRPKKEDSALRDLEVLHINDFLRKYTRNSAVSSIKMMIAKFIPDDVFARISKKHL